ncbi:MAG TPA: VCBS repeat-containing protein [Polyangiaceae bacterium]|nr:VCBS repeat-containing protein [Polyangiaceae bacterium]
MAKGGELNLGGSGGDDSTAVRGGEARCGAGAILCGGETGCCPAGNVCTRDGFCLPQTACTTNEECGSDSVCGGGSCRAWSTFTAPNNFERACRTNVDLPSLRPEIQCNWPEADPPGEFPDSVQVVGTPMVADFNFDNNPATVHPSIVFVSYAGNFAEVSGVLRVIDGATCKLQATVPLSFPLTPEVSPALGDVDNDGRPDIVVVDQEPNGASIRSGVAVYSANGNGTTGFQLLGRQRSSAVNTITALSIHDLDNDERPEILTNTGMYAYVDEESLSGMLEILNIQNSSLLEPPIVHDIDGDRIAELVTSEGIFTWDGAETLNTKTTSGNSIVWTDTKNIPSAFVGLANLGKFTTATLPQGADSVEMVVVGFGGLLLVTKVDGNVLMRVNKPGYAAGPPVIADFDGDGRMEFASPGLDRITVYDLDCLTGDDATNKGTCLNPSGKNADGILWTKDRAHGATSGASVFDFDGDGSSEVVYADQCFMRIYRGTTGEVLFSVPRSSTTRWEYPVIVDADGDGHTEIVTPSNDSDDTLGCPLQDPINENYVSPFIATHGVTVWSDKKPKRWAGSRAIWNQHSYSVTNINDDGTVPPMQTIASQWQNPTKDPNSFRQNVQGATGVSLELADLTTTVDPVFACRSNQAVAQVSVELCNRGTRVLGSGLASIALMEQGNPSNVLCTKPNAGELGAGACESIVCDVEVPDSNRGFNIIAMGDRSASVSECNEVNNMSTITNVFCQNVPR